MSLQTTPPHFPASPKHNSSKIPLGYCFFYIVPVGRHVVSMSTSFLEHVSPTLSRWFLFSSSFFGDLSSPQPHFISPLIDLAMPHHHHFDEASPHHASSCSLAYFPDNKNRYSSLSSLNRRWITYETSFKIWLRRNLKKNTLRIIKTLKCYVYLSEKIIPKWMYQTKWIDCSNISKPIGM